MTAKLKVFAPPRSIERLRLYLPARHRALYQPGVRAVQLRAAPCEVFPVGVVDARRGGEAGRDAHAHRPRVPHTVYTRKHVYAYYLRDMPRQRDCLAAAGRKEGVVVAIDAIIVPAMDCGVRGASCVVLCRTDTGPPHRSPARPSSLSRLIR